MNDREELLEELEAAIRDELDAVHECSELARKLDNRTLRALLLSIIGDGYGHARSFSVIQELMSRRNGQA